MAFHTIGDPTDDKEVHMQMKIQPILFLSRTLTSAETRYWPTELEVAGVIWAVAKLRHLINSSTRPTIIYTDHSAAIWIARQTSLIITSTNKLNLRLVRASAFLSQFDLDVRFRPGKEHVVADALSRLPQQDNLAQGLDEFLDAQVASTEATHVYNATLIEMSEGFRKAIQTGYQRDQRWTRLAPLIKEDVSPGVQFVWRDGLIYFVDSLDGRLRLCIPKDRCTAASATLIRPSDTLRTENSALSRPLLFLFILSLLISSLHSLLSTALTWPLPLPARPLSDALFCPGRLPTPLLTGLEFSLKALLIGDSRVPLSVTETGNSCQSFGTTSSSALESNRWSPRCITPKQMGSLNGRFR